METMTDKRCRSSLQAALKKMENIYGRKFEVSHQSEEFWGGFWQRVDKIAFDLNQALQKRPISLSEIESLCRKAVIDFTAECKP
jgi:hypothetical protein